MTDSPYLFLAMIVMAGCTFFLRALPFAVLRKIKGSRLLDYMGHTMPPGIMLILVVYSVSSIKFADYPFGLPAFISMFIVVIVHHVWRKALLSIVLGTVAHIMLLQSF